MRAIAAAHPQPYLPLPCASLTTPIYFLCKWYKGQAPSVLQCVAYFFRHAGCSGRCAWAPAAGRLWALGGGGFGHWEFVYVLEARRSSSLLSAAHKAQRAKWGGSGSGGSEAFQAPITPRGSQEPRSPPQLQLGICELCLYTCQKLRRL
jgi:hypothetical protein